MKQTEVKHLKEETLDSTLIYDGKIVKLFKDNVMLENGEKAVREVIKHSGGVCILAAIENPAAINNPNILFVRQYRYPQEKILLELPAGKLEHGEEPIDCARRELEEETGLITQNLKEFGLIVPTPAYDTEKIYCYIADGLRQSKQKLDKDEFLDVEQIPLLTAAEMIMNGEINDSKTVAFLLKYKFYKYG
jgi:ADP-ribose pyrophosphatase